MRRYTSGRRLFERGRVACAIAFSAALIGGPIFGVAGASGHGNSGHSPAQASAAAFNTAELPGQAGAGMAHDGGGNSEHGGWKHGGDGGGWKHDGGDGAANPAPQAAPPPAPVHVSPQTPASQVISQAAPERAPGAHGGGPPPWAGHGNGGGHGPGQGNGAGHGNGAGQGNAPGHENGSGDGAPQGTGSGNGGPPAATHGDGGPHRAAGRGGEGPPPWAAHGNGAPPPWAHGHGRAGAQASPGAGSSASPGSGSPVHTSQRPPSRTPSPVVAVPVPSAPAPVSAPKPNAPTTIVIPVSTGPAGNKSKHPSLPTFDSTTSLLSGFNTLPARVFGAGGALRLGSGAAGFGNLFGPGGRTATLATGSFPANSALGSTGTRSAATAASATSGQSARGGSRHPAGHSSSGPSYIEVVPSFVDHFVNRIPGIVWLALAASVGLAVAGAGAAVAFRHKANRQAGHFAAVAAAALTDPLTGVLNRRGFTEAVERELARARRYHRPFVLAYVDVRGLKAVNDTEGHLAGDELLKGVAALLTDCARADDVVGRLGGDELGLLLAEQPSDVATTVTHRIEEQVVRRRAALGLRAPWSLTIGTAAFPDDGQTFDELIRTADRRLYEQRGIDLR